MINVGVLQAVLKLRDQMTPALRKAQASLKTTGARMTAFGSSMMSAGSAMTMGLTLPIVGLGAAAATTFATFEKGMNRVKAVTGATVPEFAALTDQAKDLGATTKFTANEAADAMGFLGMAGFKTAEILGAMPNVLELAAAAMLDVGQAADITSNILTGYGQTTDDLAHTNNVLVKAFTSANTDLTQLGQAFKYAGPVANSAGVAFESTAAALALLGNAGIQGSMAGTSLRGALTRLMNPAGKARTLIESLGLNVMTTTGEMKPFEEIIRQLEASGATTAQMMQIFGQRAGPAMSALVSQGSEALKEMTEELTNVGDIASEIAETQMEGLAGTWTLFTSALSGALIEIGEVLSPFLTKFLELGIKMSTWIRVKLVPAFQNLSPWLQKTILGFAAIVAGTGPLLVALGAISMAVGGLATVIGAISLPVTATVLAIGGLITAFAFWGEEISIFLREYIEPWIASMDKLKAIFTEFTFEEAEAAAEARKFQLEIDKLPKVLNKVERAAAEAAKEVEKLALAEEEAANRAEYLSGTNTVMMEGIEVLQEATAFTAGLTLEIDLMAQRAEAAAEKQKLLDLETKRAALAADAQTKALADQIEQWNTGGIPAMEHAIAAYRSWGGTLDQLTKQELSDFNKTVEAGIERLRLQGEAVPLEENQLYIESLDKMNKKVTTLTETLAHLPKHFPGIEEMPLVPLEKMMKGIGEIHNEALNAPSIFSQWGDSVKGGFKSFWQGITGGTGKISGMFQQLGAGVMQGFGQIVAGGMTSLVNKSVEMGMKAITGLFKKSTALSDRMKEHSIAVEEATAKRKELEATEAQALMDLQNNWRGAEEAAERYNIGLKSLGDTYQAAKWSEETQQLADDWELLALHGKNLNTIAKKMAPTVQEMIEKYQEAGIAIPDNMKTPIEKMVELGLLTDAEGNALTDMSTLDFATPLVEQMGALVESVQLLVDTMSGQLMPQMNDVNNFKFDDKTIRVSAEYDRIEGGMNLPGAQTGTGGQYVDFGSGTPVMLHGKERIMTEAEGASDSAILEGIRRDLKTMPMMIRDAIILAG